MQSVINFNEVIHCNIYSIININTCSKYQQFFLFTGIYISIQISNCLLNSSIVLGATRAPYSHQLQQRHLLYGEPVCLADTVDCAVAVGLVGCAVADGLVGCAVIVGLVVESYLQVVGQVVVVDRDVDVADLAVESYLQVVAQVVVVDCDVDVGLPFD